MQFTKSQIEEAAQKHIATHYGKDHIGRQSEAEKNGFIAGADFIQENQDLRAVLGLDLILDLWEQVKDMSVDSLYYESVVLNIKDFLDKKNF